MRTPTHLLHRTSRLWRHLAAPLAASSLTSCLAFMGVPQTGDNDGARCQQGFDLFEQGRCRPGQAATVRVEAVRFELDQMRRECTDAASVQRADRIEQTCLPAYRQAQAGLADQRRQIRARYVNEVSALLLDPEYPAAVDRYKDIEAELRSGDSSAQATLAAAREPLVALARKHGIDPAYAKELDLW